jgi:hypothetical protein
VFPVRYELNSYILFGRNSILKGLKEIEAISCLLMPFFFCSMGVPNHSLLPSEKLCSLCVKIPFQAYLVEQGFILHGHLLVPQEYVACPSQIVLEIFRHSKVFCCFRVPHISASYNCGSIPLLAFCDRRHLGGHCLC